MRTRDSLYPPWPAPASLFVTVPLACLCAEKLKVSFIVFAASMLACIGVALLVAVWAERRAHAQAERDEALRILSGGAEESDVEIVQRLLGVKKDGIYGPRTARAAQRAVAAGTFFKSGMVARVHREQTGQVLFRWPWYRRLLRHKH